MVSLTAFSFTSEPKQKQKTTFIKDFTKVQSILNVENVKDYTFNVSESTRTTEKYIFDVGWQSKENYNYTNKKELAINSFYYNFRIWNDC